MAETVTVLKVFVASPSDVSPERAILENVVSEFNLSWGDNQKIQLNLLKWETDTWPAFGEDAQNVINQQIGTGYDIFLGIMWGRFGTSTGRADSGTKEEFDLAFQRLKDGGNIQLMLYFKDAGIPPSKTDPEQLAKVLKFKEAVAAEYGGYYHQFQDVDDFRAKTRMHLTKVVQDLLKKNSDSVGEKALSKKDEITSEIHNPLANLEAFEDTGSDIGILDIVDRGLDAINEVALILGRMTSATHDLGERIAERTIEMEAITENGKILDIKRAKTIADRCANDLELFVNRMSVEIPELYNQNTTFTDSFGELAMLSEQDDIEDVDDVIANVRDYRQTIIENLDKLNSFRMAIDGLPQMTTRFNRSRRRSIAVMDDLLRQFEIAADQTRDVEQLLDRLA